MINQVIQNVKSDYLTKARFLLNKKYSNNLANKYNILKINEILSNSKTHLVSTFKDYLLFDDFSEFFKRYYNGKESKHRIKKNSNFLFKELFIYPNYSSLEEGKYILCNIIKKQMLLNKQKRNKYYLNNELKKNFFEKKNKVFNNKIYDDIFEQQKSESFINLLFGLDNKNKENSEQIENNEIEEIDKIIKMIELNENSYMQKPQDKIIVNKIISNKNNKNRNLFRKNFSKTNILSQENRTSINNRIRNNIEEIKDSSNRNSNNIYSKNKMVNYKSIIYHRKVNSTLTCNTTKLELPLTKNLINISKISNVNKIPSHKISKEKKEAELFNNKIKNNINKNICKMTRNNKSNINIQNNTSNYFHNNKSIYIKNKVIRNNMSNKNIFENVNDENKEINNRKYSKPYSKPKCFYKENKMKGISHRTYYNNLNEVIYVERIK